VKLHPLFLILAAVSAQASPAPSPKALEGKISASISRVEPFVEIRKLAQEMGVRVWLFGGTASSFAHYVKRDQLRKAGDTRYQPDRFDYHYTSIYHSSQDLDIVVDGTETQLQQLEAHLRRRFPYVEGSKSLWEVRSLRERRGDKDALLDDFSFSHQHTDSHSTGMIELTDPQPGEARVRDLRDWSPPRGRSPQFLRDVAEGKIHYYFSPRHAETRLAAEGNNPPIVSVIRYLTKAFKEELDIRPEDEEQVRAIIEEFDPNDRRLNTRVRNWIEKNAKKIFHHAVNLEYAAKTLERFGLREKLVALGNPESPDTMSWWLSRKPLESSPLGGGSRIDPQRGPGKTAAELGIQEVSHETNSFLAYESMTRAHTGDPNVLTSRTDTVGEQAASGEGFYTARGDRGARGTGITLHFQVDPAARENVDFKVVGDFVIFRNKAAFRVIPESLNVTGLGAMKILSSPEIDPTRDQALLEMIRRRINATETVFSQRDLPAVDKFLLAESEKHKPCTEALKLWFSHPLSLKRPRWADRFDDPSFVFTTLLQIPHWKKHPDANIWIQGALERFDTKSMEEAANYTKYMLAHGHAEALLEWISHGNDKSSPVRVVLAQLARAGAEERMQQAFLKFIFTNPKWADSSSLQHYVESVRIRDATLLTPAVAKALSRAWKNRIKDPVFVNGLIDAQFFPMWVTEKILEVYGTDPNGPELLRRVMEHRSREQTDLILKGIKQKSWASRPETPHLLDELKRRDELSGARKSCLKEALRQ
jgi:hypothetical protein